MIQGLINWAVSIAAKPYKNILASRLRSNGLQYEDLLIETADVSKALARSNNVVRVERTRRIKRAFDLSVKRKLMPEEAHNYNPFDFKVFGKVKKAHAERTERALMNA
jgi:ubiquinol-cytochrome c reductase subunit 7